MDIFPLNILNDYHKVHGLPAFVKESAVLQQSDVQDLPHTAFADPQHKLPIHTKAATWCSCLTFYAPGRKSDGLESSVGSNLEKAAAFWGIGEARRQLLDNLKKQAAVRTLTDADYALVQPQAGLRALPIVDAPAVKKAAEELEAQGNRLPYLWRKQGAVAILKKAQDLSMALVNEHQLQMMAGQGMAKASEIVPQLELRAHMTKNAELRQRFNALAQEIRKTDDLDLPTLSKLAEAMDIADRAGGLYHFYGRGLERPDQLCHRHTLKEVQEKRASLIALTNGQGVSKEALAKLSADKFTALGDDFVAAIRGADGNVDVTKAAELVPTLPADDANLFVNSL